jgi:DNA repair protein RadC
VRYGSQALSSPDLLAILLRTGTEDCSAAELAQRLIAKFKDLRGLANASVKDLSRVKGVSHVRAQQIAACMELGRRLAAKVVESDHVISSPDDVVDFLLPKLEDTKREHFFALLLDTKNKVIKVHTVSVGTLDASLVHPREVFKEAIASSAASIIVAHNHPSGDPTPSTEDRQVTTRLVEAGRLLGIEVLDHIVLGDDHGVSFKKLGLM